MLSPPALRNVMDKNAMKNISLKQRRGAVYGLSAVSWENTEHSDDEAKSPPW